MKNFKAGFMGFIKNISEAVILGSFVSTLIFIIIGVIGSIAVDTILLDVILVYLIIDLFVTFSVVLLKINRYPRSIHHIDAELIGDNFIGFDKKSRSFRKVVENFFNDEYSRAVNEFIEIEKKYNLSDSEKGVLYFYIARCYDIMHYYPNALKYYEESKESGFSDSNLDFFTARCIGATGNIEKALPMYMNILDSDHNLSFFVRTDVGQMYLDNRQPEEGLKWYLEAVEKRENYAIALGGCSIAYLMLGNEEESRKYYQYAIVEGIADLEGFKIYYKEISKAVKGSDSVV